MVFIFIFSVILFSCSFALYHLPLNAVLYPTALCAFAIIVWLVIRYVKRKAKHKELVYLRSLPENLTDELKYFHGESDEDYREIIEALWQKSAEEQEHMDDMLADMVEYYTVWVHQIKTPIASMRLTLEGEDSPVSRKVNEDLFRIEQYVDMVLTYLRLDSDDSDYVFKKHSLDTIIKGCIRKFAGQFIDRKIQLEYAGTDKQFVTDDKWLSFVIEQVLSNALKYTPEGKVSIYLEGDSVLCISDTGIGISADNLPRIFEKGYTGYNGRTDKRASGIGLYLCRRICENLGHKISAESAVGEGTVIKIDLAQIERRHE